MSTRRLGVAVAVLGGFLYAVGGSDGTSPLNTGTYLTAHNTFLSPSTVSKRIHFVKTPGAEKNQTLLKLTKL